MYDSEYAYAVARIRAVETGLLTKADIEQIISADSYRSALQILADKGWDMPGDGADIFDSQADKAWAIIKESVPDSALLDAMIIGNDFINAKAAIKTVFSDIEPERYMVKPFICDPAVIIAAVTENDFSDLPDYLRDCTDTAYHTISSGGSGQSAEMIIDKACLETRRKYAGLAQSNLLTEIVSLGIAAANIKIAKRCAATGKSKETALGAMCDSPFNEALTDAAFAGEELAPLIKEAGFPDIAKEADGDFSSLEMKCDNLITQKLAKTKFDAFGPDPVIAYYYAKTAEIKNVRIILSAKAAGVPVDIIRQRVRDIYE